MLEHAAVAELDAAEFPIAVVLGHTARDPTGGGWRVLGVLVGQRFASPERRRTLIRSGPEGEQYLWTGFRLTLRKELVPDYILNVSAERPAVFVVCQRSPEHALVPVEITVSLDEAQCLDATDLRDGSDEVLQAPMPPEVFRWLEQFVRHNYRPPEPPRRKRDGGRRGARQGGRGEP
jgi:hypothetical protein